MYILLIAFLLQEPSFHNIRLERVIDFQRDDIPETHLTGIRQLESSGEHLYIVKRRYPTVLQITTDGEFVRLIGHHGQGPGELGHHGPQAIAVHQDHLWIYSGDMRRLNYYENGEFIIGFKPKNYHIRASRMTSYVFAFDSDTVLLQAHPSTGALALTYDYGGALKKKVGKILPIEPAFLGVNPALNNTLWKKSGETWWCLFLYRPILRQFDKRFKLIKEVAIMGPEIETLEEKYFENKKDPDWTYPKAHFSDMAIFRGQIHILSNYTLYSIDEHSGTLLARSRFKGTKTLVKELKADMDLVFNYLAFDKAGVLYLSGGSLIWEQDGIWVASLPSALKHRQHKSIP